jgi:general secretion pathway protein L
MRQILACPPLQPNHSWSAWLVNGRLGQPGAVGSALIEPLDAAPEQWPAAQEVVLMVPARMISWHRATLPRLTANRWRQALAGLLEDQLLSDPARLHLALAPGSRPGTATWVAACDKTWLEQALQGLQAAGRHADRIVPEFEPGEPVWLLLGQPEAGQLVQTGPDGVEVLPLPPSAEQAREAVAAFLGPGNLVPPVLRAEPAMAELAQHIFKRPADLLPRSQRLQQALASPWNLAQFDLSSGPSNRWPYRLFRRVSAWLRGPSSRPLRWGLLVLLLVHWVGVQAWIWRQSDQNPQEELRAILRSTFPQVTVVIDPLAQMQRQVQALRQASATALPDDLGVMLSVLAEARPVPPKRLEYSAGQLQLPDWSMQAAQARELQSALALRGYELHASGAVWLMRAKTP